MAADNLGFEWAVDSIMVGARHRKDLGDLQPLTDSISQHGLIQLITVTPDGVLISGARRLEAIKRLGWKTVNVWIRTGLSDRLTALMAERDENLSHKGFTKTELAELYEELKDVVAEEAARRQQASRFGAEPETGPPGGAANLAAPWEGRYDSRRKAADMIGTGASHMTMEKVLAIKQIAADTTRPQGLRDQAAEAVAEIDAGGPVDPQFLRLRSLVRIDDLERMAADAGEPDPVRGAARAGAILLRKLEDTQPMTPADLDKAAKAALDRVKAARRGRKPVPEPKPAKPEPGPKTRSVKQFIWTWNEMSDWPQEYDVAAVAEALSDKQWQQFKKTMADGQAFLDRVAAARAGLGLSA
ncbi:MAG: ParB N-terminal domain-containing protein [Bifidobacteriaceae bacterium]|nr:ParB N-terminal domain-containing protein [Bifidobacteriaceae bacterium]